MSASPASFLPATYDVVWTVVVVLALGLLVTSFVVWSRSKDRSIISLGWFFVMLAFPILGPVGYLVDTRRRTRLERESEA